jgi:hypothetical protein
MLQLEGTVADHQGKKRVLAECPSKNNNGEIERKCDEIFAPAIVMHIERSWRMR